MKKVLPILLLLVAGNAYAYRPFMTEDADVAGKGVFQTEMSWDYLKWKNGDVDNVFLLVSPIYGPTESLELSAEIPYIMHQPKDGNEERGAGDINLVAKQIVYRETETIPLLCLKGIAKLDTGDYGKGLSFNGDKDYSLLIVASKAAKQFQFLAQYGYDWIGKRNNQELRDITVYGFAADCGITEPFHLVAEVYGNQNPVRGEKDIANLLTGFTYKVNEHLILDASYRRGLTETSLDWGTGVGLAMEFK